ncbi:hypothetical protein ANANG_G00008780 [Anguilla anguilla]|uniref:Uncharacterized protein n=1 Tax=Anguilla anguilla TaxID=7936 RepID=A0A9D3MX93_ANGAN|nr:hypothetical protein ANANG_G00008780 [Anguilla anguilla]
MRRLPQQLLCLCLTGALLLRLCKGNDDEFYYDYDYNTTAAPDYDYNATFDYMYFSNSSSMDYRVFEIMRSGEKDTQEVDKGNTAPETGLPNLLLIVTLSIHQLYQLH